MAIVTKPEKDYPRCLISVREPGGSGHFCMKAAVTAIDGLPVCRRHNLCIMRGLARVLGYEVKEREANS